MFAYLCWCLLAVWPVTSRFSRIPVFRCYFNFVSAMASTPHHGAGAPLELLYRGHVGSAVSRALLFSALESRTGVGRAW